MSREESSVRVTASNFGELVVQRFPQLRGRIEEDPELFHLQVTALETFAERAARQSTSRTLKRCIRFVHEVWENCDDEMSNAILVSFLEHIDPETVVGKRIYDALTPELKQGWHDINSYMEQLLGKDWRSR
ncbi:MAG: hypothetical protein AB7O65_14085 [Candidatus Korobacteraceae bacterium]